MVERVILKLVRREAFGKILQRVEARSPGERIKESLSPGRHNRVDDERPRAVFDVMAEFVKQ